MRRTLGVCLECTGRVNRVPFVSSQAEVGSRAGLAHGPTGRRGGGRGHRAGLSSGLVRTNTFVANLFVTNVFVIVEA
ncbi:hypothetical protein Athai_59990 [Actinocatenispora thailandica]|uniref:Uncharacterized protein n=1 Tax=Actinocatenispora thailandica TaxID=227318 RepID=A0A7R7I0E6_9ACTN|nr:hypothetical protein Athai_59990 [Actinocatenispora thailandica]